MSNSVIEVLYEDNHLLALNKPCGVPSQPDVTKDECMIDIAKSYLKNKYNKSGNVFAGLIHRLDRPVSGVILIAKTSKSLQRMNQLFKERKVKKTYWAVVKNKPPHEQGLLEHWLVKNSEKNKTLVYTFPHKHGHLAQLYYKVLDASRNFYLLEVNPITGRPHQIRAQLAAIGSPIKGDLKYGYDRSNKNTAGISLHARSIEFVHPVKKELLFIQADTPKDDVWQYFK
ncbi:MAG: RNA pseudouridine synthase [Cytophagaceae bacterium]|nr:RNA pseudouridine synthase [Cytophagaceae bacterium]MDW8457284.1 RNA pseudouridine synthase [Cytophagaceae bacterium]